MSGDLQGQAARDEARDGRPREEARLLLHGRQLEQRTNITKVALLNFFNLICDKKCFYYQGVDILNQFGIV